MRHRTGLLLLASLVAACSSDSGGVQTFTPKETAQAAVTSFQPVVSGDYAIYVADEATTGASGTDLDGDGNADDTVTFSVSLVSGTQRSADLLAEDACIVGNFAWLVVDELVTGVDHSGAGGVADLVLMHWVLDGEDPPVYVDDLERTAATPCVAVGERLYYVTPAAAGVGSTNLSFVDTAEPTLPLIIAGPGGGLDSCRILGERDGLLLLTLDENVDGDLDGDLDGTDGFVLATLDGTDVAANVTPTTLALRDASTPFDVEVLDVAGDGVPDEGWLVAVLVDEGAEGADLNDPSLFDTGWLPSQCPSGADGDQTDEVLHYLYVGHPTFGPAAVNTGLVGRNKVLVLDGAYVATLSPEEEQGCDLNQDGLGGDLFARWCEAVDPALGSMGVFPPGAGTLMDALAAGPAGGSQGLIELDGNLVVIVDEATDDQDHDGDGSKDHRLIAYVDDLGTDLAWEYDLVDPSVGSTTIPVDWMGAEAELDRVGIAISEDQLGLNLNTGCSGVDAKDTDTTDQLLGWLHFEQSGLVAYGLGFALDPFNAGSTLTGGNLFFRLDEGGDATDYNNDSDTDDVVLARFPIGAAACAILVSTLNGLAGPAVVSDNERGAVFFFDEADAGVDANGDGDDDDVVLRWMRFF